MKNLRTARDNWGKNHRHQGGIGALLRCWRGQRALERRKPVPPSLRDTELEVLTFSIVPWLTAQWGRSLSSALADRGHRLRIGDCSGGLRGDWLPFLGPESVEVLPCLNHHHGEKLDLFFSKVCSCDLVLVCDDDIFWLDGEPLSWALERFRVNPSLAVVSLAPRTLVSSVLEGQVEEPMGSSCLIIRRSIWQREQCSFQMAPDPQGADWFYDTCDLANVELLDRGFGVEIAPPEIRRSLVPLEAISAWILKAQKHPPERLAQIADLPIRRTKAFQALETGRRFAELAHRSLAVGDSVTPNTLKLLETASEAVGRRLESEERTRIEVRVEASLTRIENGLRGASTKPVVEP